MQTKFYINIVKALLLSAFLIQFLQATPNCVSGVGATTLAATIEGDGLTITNPRFTYIENSRQAGTFTNGVNGANLQIDSGIILTTGSINQACHINDNDDSTVINSNQSTPSNQRDPDLQAILNRDNLSPFDTVVFEFDVTLDNNTRMLLIEYQFASEEYPEYVGSVYNDAFGFFISGGDLTQTYNVARVVDNQTNMTTANIQTFDPVAVNNVNNGAAGNQADGTPFLTTNSAYYINNNQVNEGGTSPVQIQYDGLTTRLQAAVDNLTPGQTYRFKMALADASDAQLDSAVYVRNIRGIRGPEFCYDYGYSQDGITLTHYSDGNTTPILSAPVTVGEDVNVSLYIKNIEESELEAEHFTLDILDIDDAQVEYSPNSVLVTQPNQNNPEPVSDGSLTITSNSVRNIPLENLGPEDHFYIYYALEPQIDPLNTPIHAVANYDVTLDLGGGQTRTFDFKSRLGTDIPMCSGEPLKYEPVWGPFNVGAKGIYESDNPKFNIPTQVVKRPGEFAITSHDKNDTNYVNELNTSSLIGVEMIEMGKFNTTGASCNEESASISQRFWAPFENNSNIDFNEALQKAIDEGAINVDDGALRNYFSQAKQNTTFRVVFNTTGDGEEIIKTEKLANGKYRILNFPQFVKDAGLCKKPVRVFPYGHNNSSTTKQVPVACANAGAAGVSLFELNRCSECILGYSTYNVCARDNFAIRPVSYNVRLFDIDQKDINDTTKHALFASNRTGVDPTDIESDIVDIASGYPYRFDINATTYLGNEAAVGYNRAFRESSADEYNVSLNWVRVDLDTNDCNDTTNHILEFYFTNGLVSQNNKAPEIGEYELNIIDTTWTTVDAIPEFMGHHKEALVHGVKTNVSNYFVGFGNALDCLKDDNNIIEQGILPSISGNVLSNINGCVIDSVNTNEFAEDGEIEYANYNFIVHPYQLTPRLLPSFGMDSNTSFNNAWLYFNRLDDNDTLLHSHHLRGVMSAQGFDGSVMHNFTSGCFAKDINTTINFTALINSNTTVLDSNYTYRWSDDNRTSLYPALTQYNPYAEFNTSKPIININKTSFTKGDTDKLDGQMYFDLYTNIDKNISKAHNPIRVILKDVNLTCKDASLCQMQADLNETYETNGKQDINTSVIHYYGRVDAPDYENVSPIAARIYYEVYCDDCNRTEFNITGPVSKQGLPWFINEHHGNTDQGHVETFSSVGSTQLSKTETGDDNNITDGNETISLTYVSDSVDRIKMEPDPWLLHNQFDENATYNDFMVTFFLRGKWAGGGTVNKESDEFKIGTTLEDNTTSIRSNRRISW